MRRAPEEPARICECCATAVTLEDYYQPCPICGTDWAPSPQRLWDTIASIRNQIDELYGPGS